MPLNKVFLRPQNWSRLNPITKARLPPSRPTLCTSARVDLCDLEDNQCAKAHVSLFALVSYPLYGLKLEHRKHDCMHVVHLLVERCFIALLFFRQGAHGATTLCLFHTETALWIPPDAHHTHNCGRKRYIFHSETFSTCNQHVTFTFIDSQEFHACISYMPAHMLGNDPHVRAMKDKFN